ncbi:MAG: LPS export ABC transporter periplasmic protein LptC [Paracoccaceae bacterium]
MANGSAITLSAEQAIPIIGSGTGLRASGLRGVFQTPDGGKVDITATTGILDNTERTASLSGGVSLITSNGYTITTDAIIANLETAAISTDGSILANGPLGHVSAGKLILQQKTIPDTENTYELVFTEGVKLIYTPHNP